jgi:hypothetical protein
VDFVRSAKISVDADAVSFEYLPRVCYWYRLIQCTRDADITAEISEMLNVIVCNFSASRRHKDVFDIRWTLA